MANNSNMPDLSITLGVVDKFTAPFRAFGRAVEFVQRPLRRLRDRMSAIGETMGLNRITNQLGRLRQNIGGVGNAFGQAFGRASLLFGGSGLAVGGFLTNMKSVNDEVYLMSERLGVSTDRFQELAFAAGKFGIDRQELTDYLKDLGVNSDDFWNEGGGTGAEAFKRLGLSRQDIANVQGDLSALFDMVAPRIAKITNDAAAGNIAEQIFSGDASTLLPLVREYSKRQEELRKEAHETNNVISEETIKASRKFTESWMSMTDIMTGFRNTIGTAVLPVINDLMTSLTKLFDRLREDGTFQRWADNIKNAIPTMEQLRNGIDMAREKMQPFINVFAWMTERFGTFETIAGAVVLFITGPLIAAFVALTASVLSFGTVLLTTPIGWILGGLAALAGAVYLVINNWDGITEWWSGLWQEVTEAFDTGFIQGVMQLLLTFNPLNVIASAFKNIVEWLWGDGILSDIGNAALNLGESLIDSMLKGVTSTFHRVTDWIKGQLSDFNPFSGMSFEMPFFGDDAKPQTPQVAPRRVNAADNAELVLPGGRSMTTEQPGDVERTNDNNVPSRTNDNNVPSRTNDIPMPRTNDIPMPRPDQYRAPAREERDRHLVLKLEGLPAGTRARVEDENGQYMGDALGTTIPQ